MRLSRVLAWQTAALHRTKKMPDFSKWMGTDDASKMSALSPEDRVKMGEESKAKIDALQKVLDGKAREAGT